MTRRLTPLDRVLAGLDRSLRTLAPGPSPSRELPPEASSTADAGLDPGERRHAAGLLRVDHAGEVAAQGLYQGQALTARDPRVRESMEASAREETEHLAWCRSRLAELGARPSALDPVWFLGSLAIGLGAGLAGDRWSLGFVVETERQVVDHLGEHIERLPAADARSRAVLERMRADEARHACVAHRAGAAELPGPVRGLMRRTARIMTETAYRL